jgi:penicillin-binding protein 2
MPDKKDLYNPLLSRRTFILGIGKLSLLSILASKMFYMQLIKQDKYKTLSDKNRINLVVVPPIRGKIYDAEGTLLATNKTCFRLLLNKNDNLKYYIYELELINQILDLPIETKNYIVKKAKNAARRVPVVILDQLTWAQISLIEEQKPQLTSVFIDVGYMRAYPMSLPTSHLVGYMGQANEQEKQKLIPGNIEDFAIGKSGIEKYYENLLRGEFGYKQIEVNAFGKCVRELSKVEPVSGKDIYLNIDANIQDKIWPYLNKQGCSAVVMDSTNGNVIILATTPPFESNNFAKLSKNYWDILLNDPYKPLINKAVQNTYPPGSVFKIITVLAALEAGIKEDKIVHCIGGASALGTNSFRCSSKHGHGAVDMRNAIKYSCNAYIYEMAKLIGADKIIEMATRFGFGAKTNIDIASEASGFVPSKQWKQDKLKSKWTIGDTLNLSLGQGFLLSTPIQLARFVASIASNGKLFTPKIVKSEPHFEQVKINLEYLKIIQEAMYLAVNTQGGTAYLSRIFNKNYQLAGKTGTAQVQAKASIDDDLNRLSIARERRNHAVFIGFAPYHDPRYAISVFVDHGGAGGKAGAPIASRIMEEILKKYIV